MVRQAMRVEMSVDEEFALAELTDPQRAEHRVRCEAILVRRGLAQPHGGDRRSNRQVGDLKSYANKTAADLSGVLGAWLAH